LLYRNKTALEKIMATTAEKLEVAKAAWKKAKARVLTSNTEANYIKELKAFKVVTDLQSQLEKEFDAKAAA
jgi:hypothetical protein